MNDCDFNYFLAEIRKKLDESKYQRLNADPDARDANEFREEDLDAVLVLINQNSYMTYRNYAQVNISLRLGFVVFFFSGFNSTKTPHALLTVTERYVDVSHICEFSNEICSN